MILWHVGGAVLIARYVFRDPRMDLRFLVLGALLPDLIDKPVGTILFFETFRNGRIFGHTLVFSLLILTAVMLGTRRGTARRRSLLGVPIGSLLHLLLDGMWTEPVTFWWPLFGWSFPAVHEAYWAAFLSRLGDPLLLVREAAGAAYLGYLWRKGRLWDPERRRELIRTGRLVTD